VASSDKCQFFKNVLTASSYFWACLRQEGKNYFTELRKFSGECHRCLATSNWSDLVARAAFLNIGVENITAAALFSGTVFVEFVWNSEIFVGGDFGKLNLPVSVCSAALNFEVISGSCVVHSKALGSAVKSSVERVVGGIPAVVTCRCRLKSLGHSSVALADLSFTSSNWIHWEF